MHTLNNKKLYFVREMINESYKYDSVTVAYYLVASANERRLSINMTKLQKLLYIAYGTYLAVTGSRLINEHPQAWPYGPVFPTTRNKLLKKDLYSIRSTDERLKEINEDAEMRSLANIVLTSFGNRSASTLSEWSHQSGSPWDRTVNQKGFNWGDRIPDEYIQEYFNTIIVRNNATAGQV